MLIEGTEALDLDLAAVISDGLEMNEAIRVLRRYSLVRRDAEQKSLTIHRLVQATLCDAMEHEEQRTCAEHAGRVVALAFPEPDLDQWKRCELCLPHTLTRLIWLRRT